MLTRLCTNTDQCSLTEDTEKQGTLQTIDTTCDEYNVDLENMAPKLTNPQRPQNPPPMPKQQASLSNPPPKPSDSLKRPSEDPSEPEPQLELRPKLIMDIDELSEEVNLSLIIDTLEKAVKYIAVATTQLKTLSPISTKQLCDVLRDYLKVLPRDVWFWIYRERNRGLELI